LAELTGNIDERRRALVALSRLSTTDSRVVAQLGELDYNLRHLDMAVDELRSALALDPENPTLLNMLGYAQVLNGNLDGARDAFERYRTAAPNDVNPLDSLGEAYFFAGKFAEAERTFLEAHDKMAVKSGVELMKAAQARLYTGDIAGADGIFQRYAEIRRSARDPFAGLEAARWRYIEGKQKEAVSAAEAVAANGTGDVGAYANAELAIWYTVVGQSGPAQERAARALQLATSPQVRAASAIARFVTQPKEDPSQWLIAAEQTFGPATSPVKTIAIAYGLLLSHQFGPASEPFRTLYQQTPPGLDGQVRALYAWTLVETSRKADAVPLVQIYPMPFGPGEPLFSTLVFPRFLSVRATALDATGDHAAARQSLDLFHKFSNHPEPRP
jgi:tetratricopeptide (TPR) repeat protein